MMTEALETAERQDMVREVKRLCSGVILSVWTVMSEGVTPPVTESRRCELYEGQSLVLDLLTEELTKVYRKLNAE